MSQILVCCNIFLKSFKEYLDFCLNFAIYHKVIRKQALYCLPNLEAAGERTLAMVVAEGLSLVS